MVDAAQFGQLVARLLAEGCREVPISPETQGALIVVLAAMRCDECAHIGLRCRGFISTTNVARYHAFVVCPPCGAAEEF